MKKSILFVINAFSRAGAETALLELLRQLNPEQYDISLFILTAQGEMLPELPSHVHVLNASYDSTSVLSKEGNRKLSRLVLRSLVKRGTGIRLLPYLLRNFWDMLLHGSIARDKLLWRVLSDGAPRWDTQYDLAVAYLEGGSTYYVADHVHAKKKAAFVHIDYAKAGYTRKLDRDCYRKFDTLFAVSDEAKKCFQEFYPEHADKLEVFHNILNIGEIRQKSLLPGGFTDEYSGTRILTVGRLNPQKALELSVEALKLLKDAGGKFRWYVLGEGSQRSKLQHKINALGLAEDFLLCGAVENPYPYFAQTDLYVHASRFEGKSIAVQEAQVLECVILASDCSGNLENISDGLDGRLCALTPEAIRDGILWLMDHPEERRQYAKAAGQKHLNQTSEIDKLVSLIEKDSD